MRTSERRHAKLLEAISRVGSVKELAEQTGASKKYLDQIVAGFQGKNDRKPRSVGDGLAEKIEKALGESPGWMDRESEVDDIDIAGITQSNERTVPIIQMDVLGSMGPGATVPSHEDVVAIMQVNESALRKQLGNTPISGFRNLRLISAYGDSMKPTFRGGDVLLVDIGVMDVLFDAVYVADYDGELFIKRFQRRPGGSLRMLSDNKDYDHYDIDNGKRDRLRVLGRVLMAWNASML